MPCQADPRTVTSDEVDQRLAALINDMLYAFHHRIVDQATRQRYSVWELLESVRAVRDVCGGGRTTR